MEQKDHQQASGKNSSALRFGRAIHFSYPHLKQVTARHRPSKIVLVDKQGLGAAERRGQPSTKALLASSVTVLSSRRSLCVMEEYDSTAEK
jgi:hypothetical protein